MGKPSPAPLDRIHITDLRVRCILGINPEEREKQQEISIDMTLYGDFRQAGRTDEMADTADYRRIKKAVAAMAEKSSYYLVERLAQHACDIALEDPKVERVRVRVEKPGALRFARSVGVEIDRGRDDDA